jgi:glyoxylate/hydroxypyruvate reductase A
VDVLLATPGNDASQWQAALARALPEARLHAWPDAPAVVDFAAVWKPAPAVFERVRVRRAIANLGAGVDALLALPTLPADVPIVRLEDAGMAEQMAEYVLLAVLSAFREERAYADQQRARQWLQRPRLPKGEFTVGLLGLGVLGQAVARPLRELGFPLLGWSRADRQVAGVDARSGPEGLADTLARSRVLVCLLPSTSETRGLLDRARLARLPRGAHVVNVARGDLVVDEDLVALLDDGHLASATLDVFRHEPLPPSHPFWHHPKITLTPHVSAVTMIDASAAQVADKFRAIARGEPVGGIVDRARGY